MRLVLYSKQDCCLCEGLLAKLQQVKNLSFELEIREISSNSDWLERYQYEVPVLCLLNDHDQEQVLPRLSPRSPIEKLESLLQRYI